VDETNAAHDGMLRPVGAILAAARSARGIELADVARETRVPVRHLAAIEADSHDNLPALPYAIGFVKAFARAVGVDADAAAAQFRGETSKGVHVPVASAMTPLDERRLPPRGVITASLAALAVAVAGIVAWSAGAFDRAPPAAPVAAVAPPAVAAAKPPPVTMSAPPPAAASPPPVAASPVAAAAAVPPAAAGTVVITASEDAWFKVSVYDAAAGKVVTVKTGVLAKGERYAPPPTPGLRLWTGRAGALRIAVDGRQVPPLGGPVETVKNVSLDPADLRTRLASQPLPAPGRAGPPVG